MQISNTIYINEYDKENMKSKRTTETETSSYLSKFSMSVATKS